MNVLNRRDVLRGGMKVAAGAALVQAAGRAVAQFPPLQPIGDGSATLVTTTEQKPWQAGQVYKPAFTWTMLNLNLGPVAADAKPMQGFGGCFNELGWTSLQKLSQADRDAVMHELFDPAAGARFTYCRMPIGANDYATGAYSYDETPGDFALDHFSVDHDRKTLIPFIHAALERQPKLKVWASPWTPPSWMKRNNFYAEAAAIPGFNTPNGIRPDQIGHEGEDMFIQEPRYFEAYARYFGKFIDAYKAAGIEIGMVMPQNEFNSAQNFPSCTWTPEGLARFLHALGPEMAKRHVDIFFGTLERGNPKLLETVMSDPEAARYVKGLGAQWAGKNALSDLHMEYPQLTVFQSEQECGDGNNDWAYTSYCWQLMKHYFRSGATGYMYWNISTDKGGLSTWGWHQNSLVTVDPADRSYKFNYDYYLLKHLTHSVEVGAKRLNATGTCDDALAFQNPDGSTVALVRNELPHSQQVAVTLGSRTVALELPPDSISTLSMKAALA